MATFPSKVNYATGDVLTATNMNDVGGALNLLESAQYAAGKNKVINGNFGIWQRSTTFTMADSSPRYGAADRFMYGYNGSTPGTNTISREAFPVGQTDVPDNPTYFQRWTVTALGTSQTRVDTWQYIEDVNTFASQTVTLSFYVKSSGTFGISTFLEQNFGSGGSATVTTVTGTGNTSTSWQRFTTTVTLPSITGKTVGANNFLRVLLRFNNPTTGATFDVSNVQLEAASTASPFQTASGSIGGELALCQRYYYRNTPGIANGIIGLGTASSTTSTRIQFPPKVTMRIAPTSLEYAGNYLTDSVNAFTTLSSVTLSNAGANSLAAVVNVASGLTQFRPYEFVSLNTTDYIAWSAEL
jgi:hypothetical protein